MRELSTFRPASFASFQVQRILPCQIPVLHCDGRRGWSLVINDQMALARRPRAGDW